MAVDEFRQHLLDFPEDVNGHVNISLALSDLDRFDEAREHAGKAISLAPDDAVPHYAMACALRGAKKRKEALEAINEALRLDPEDPDAYAFRAALSFEKKTWKESLADADAGLALNPEHNGCLNIRAQSLVMLNQRALAAQTLDDALTRHPEDPTTHANTGWAALERGQPKQAMEHFREALRLDPDNEWARQGIVESMKAGNIIYRVFLKWLFLMMKLPAGAQVALVVGGLVGVNAISRLSDSWPAAEPYILVLIMAYLAFAVLTWVADLAFNLLLRLNRFGRLALTDDQRRSSTLFGIWVVLALVAAGVSWATDNSYQREYGLLQSILSLVVGSAMIKFWKRPRGLLVVAAGVAWVAIAVFVGTQMELVNGQPMITVTGDSLRKWLTPLLLAVQFLPAATRDA